MGRNGNVKNYSRSSLIWGSSQNMQSWLVSVNQNCLSSRTTSATSLCSE